MRYLKLGFVLLVVAAALTTSSVAMAAQSLQVAFGPISVDWNPLNFSFTGSQTSTFSTGGTYTGVFRARGSMVLQGSDLCVASPTITLSFPNETAPTSSVQLRSATDLMCLSRGYTGQFTIIANSGRGVFAGASGGGTAVYTAPNIVTFNDASGNFGPPPLSATPELESVLLFGGGGVGLLSYVLLRRRARGTQQ